jgi:hypothetical protein
MGTCGAQGARAQPVRSSAQASYSATCFSARKVRPRSVSGLDCWWVSGGGIPRRPGNSLVVVQWRTRLTLTTSRVLRTHACRARQKLTVSMDLGRRSGARRRAKRRPGLTGRDGREERLRWGWRLFLNCSNRPSHCSCEPGPARGGVWGSIHQEHRRVYPPAGWSRPALCQAMVYREPRGSRSTSVATREEALHAYPQARPAKSTQPAPRTSPRRRAPGSRKRCDRPPPTESPTRSHAPTKKDRRPQGHAPEPPGAVSRLSVEAVEACSSEPPLACPGSGD